MATEEELKAAIALDAHSDESSGDEATNDGDERVESLVAGRSKRATAGNRMSSMVAEIAADDDLELLFADDGEGTPDEEFEEDVDEGGSDNDLGDSSDDEDQGPAAGGEDLEGEKEIEKQARDERKRKRKAQQALTRPSKKIKHVPLPGAARAPPAPKAKNKKVERLSWMPMPGEAIRSSRRGATTAQSEALKQRIEVREEERKLLAHKLEAAAKRREEARANVMTQEEHLAEAAQVEKENSKSLNRWQAQEHERREQEKERLAALQNRRLEGPVISYWSGAARWLGEKLSAVGVAKIEEVEQREIVKAEREKEREEKQKIKEEKERQKAAERKAAGILDAEQDGTPVDPSQISNIEGEDNVRSSSSDPSNEVHQVTVPMSNIPAEMPASEAEKGPDSTNPALSQTEPQRHPTGMMSGPEPLNPGTAGGAQTGELETQHASTSPRSSGREDSSKAPSIGPVSSAKPDDTSRVPIPEAPVVVKQEPVIQPPSSLSTIPAPSTPHTTLPPYQAGGPQQFVFSVVEPGSSLSTQTSKKESGAVEAINASNDPFKLTQPESPAAPPPPPAKPEIAARNLVSILNVEFGGKNDSVPVTPLPKELLNCVLLSKSSKSKKGPSKPPAPGNCPITGLPVKYRDPATGVGYHNHYAYKQLQRVADGRLKWSEMAGCYVSVGTPIPAQGVPEGFAKALEKQAAAAE